ncbi:MAG: NusG domain II-containing protein [Eubacterium sp.]|nr:NusG domain II-containing protein [Eubacterium sp.]
MKKADFILIAVVAVIVGALVFFLYGFDREGAYVQIEIDGNITETLSLNEDAIREIATENGGKNVLVIKDGEAEMREANCPDGICTHHRKIHRNGDSIICLPHKVVVSVVNERNADDIDAVA